MPFRKKRAAIYARYSSQHQTELSVEGQTERILEYCKKNGFEIVKEYADRGISAFLIEKRLDFQKLIQDAMESKFDYVIVWSTDRFARSRLDARKYKELLAEYGIKVVSVSEPSIEGPENILLESNQEMLAEYFAAKLARDSMRGMITKAKKGQYLGGIVPFGYRKVKVNENDWGFEIDEKEAKVVRKIFEMRAEGVSIMQIARYMNQAGWKTRRGKAFTNASIDWILSNEKYKGIYTFNNRNKKGRFNYYKEEVVRVSMPDLAIVPPNLWQKVQKMPGVQRQPKLLYLLSGKLKCGECGYPLVGSSYGGKKNQGGAYLCQNCRRKKKLYLKIGRDKIEKYVIDFLKEQIQLVDIGSITESINKKMDSKAQKGRSENIAEEVAKIDTSIRNITKAIESGTYSQTLLNRISELEREKEELHNEMTKLRLQQVKYKKVECDEVEKFFRLFAETESFQMKKDLVDLTLSYVKVNWKKPRSIEVVSIFGSKKIVLV
ncbi:MAG: recombinase family protein [Thermotogota bacterium]|nr:recombinase family protein [Thermotogota bacterium]